MFYHGSIQDFPIGFKLYPKKDGYVSLPEVLDIESAFEYFRPENKIPRGKSVFLVDEVDNIDNVGAYDDFIFIVEPENNYIEKSDLSWYSEISCIMGDFFKISELNEEAIQCIKNYWNCISSNNPVFEYRCLSATIIDNFDD